MLNGKNAVITGASRGIGRAIALEFAKNGANVAIIYSGNDAAADEVLLKAEVLGIKAKSYKCDVSDFELSKSVCAEICADFGSVDILVNNAGITRDNLLMKMSEADFDSVISVNLKGAFNFTKHLSRTIIRSPAGRILNISSISGMMGNAGQVNYSAAKSGLIAMTKTLAKELAPRGVTCNAIAPGFIDTDMTSALTKATQEYVQTAIPLKRMGKTDEVAVLALFLASEYASYITGEVIKIDGGLYI